MLFNSPTIPSQQNHIHTLLHSIFSLTSKHSTFYTPIKPFHFYNP